MSDTAPSPPAIKPNAIKAAWRRFKDRLKLTWIGWFYICARRTLGGSVLLFFMLIGFSVVLIGLFPYLSFRPYASWDDLPCQTGTLVKVHSVQKGESTGRLVDEAGVEHKFYSRNLFGNFNNARITSYLGQELTLCYVDTFHVLPPFYMREAYFAFYPDGTSSRRDKTMDEGRAELLKLIEISLLWFMLPLLLWLLKRHGREAWRERGAHLLALSQPSADANLTATLTQPQADYLLTHFDILTQTLSPTGGFDATVWKGKAGGHFAGQVFVSMRGTAGAQDISDDITLAARGIPYNQIRDMASWWMKATAKPGDVVQQVKVDAVGNLGVVYSFAQDKPAIATGELFGQVASITSVNGHSLGGYLSTAFTRLFGANVQSVSTFNSAGFSDAAGPNIKAEFDSLVSLLGISTRGTGSFESAGAKQTNFKADNGVDFTVNSLGEVPYWALGFNQYGAKVALNQEEGTGPPNHSMFKLTDMLALGTTLQSNATNHHRFKVAA